MNNIIRLPDPGFRLKGACKVITRSVFSGEIVDIQEASNILFPAYLNAIVKDLALDLRLSTPKVMAFSRTGVDADPVPTELDDEFRSGVSRFYSDDVYQIVSVLGSAEGNSGGGNIRSIGFYIGEDATTTPGTGTLCSLINTLNVAKSSALEVTFQYEITFGAASE